MVRSPGSVRISRCLNTYDHQRTRPTPLLRTRPTRRCGLCSGRLFSSVVLRRLPIRREGARRRRPSHIQTVGCWANFQHTTPVAWLPFNEHRPRNSGSCPRTDVSVRSLYHIHFLPILTYAPGGWNPVLVPRFNSQEIKVPPC